MMSESLVSELQCPVCLELLTWPVILPCSHVLCRTPCAERLFNHGFVRCPVCRDNSFVSGGIHSLPRVISLENIIEHVQHPPALPAPPSDDEEDESCGPNDISCQLCDESSPRKAVKSCMHCNASYCRQCLRLSHPARQPFNEHKLIEPKKYPKPKELRCIQHDAKVNIYCMECRALCCLLCADDKDAHPAHQILSLTQAVDHLKITLGKDQKQLEESQERIHNIVSNYHQGLNSFQQCVQERRSAIIQQCDGLINEVETKRAFFLSDLEYEEKSKTDSLLRQIDVCQKQCIAQQSLVHCVREVFKETDECTFLQLAILALDKINKTLQVAVYMPPGLSAMSLNHKVVDFRKEKAIIRDLAYLTVPDTPRIDVTKCSRSTSSVVLVLCIPQNENDVIDGYKVFYSVERSKPPDQWEMVDFKTPGETRKCGRGPQAESAICLMHNNLQSGTVYYFGVLAYNAKGEGEMSEVITCTTLSETQTTIQVPDIIENQCRTYTYSIQLHSPSPLESNNESGIAHYLLYRETSMNKIWKSISLYGRADHRVFGLEPDTMYDFIIMACDKNSECQVSNMVTLRTEQSAY